MKKIKKNDAVSEVVGTALLLGMAIALFAIVQIIAIALPFNPNPPSARLIGNIEGDTIYVFHHGGESLISEDTTIIFTINGTSYSENASDILNAASSNVDKEFWNIGEKVSYTHSSSLEGLTVNIMVTDAASNSVIMTSTIQE